MGGSLYMKKCGYHSGCRAAALFHLNYQHYFYENGANEMLMSAIVVQSSICFDNLLSELLKTILKTALRKH